MEDNALDQFGLASDVLYQLNKKGRWKLPELIEKEVISHFGGFMFIIIALRSV